MPNPNKRFIALTKVLTNRLKTLLTKVLRLFYIFKEKNNEVLKKVEVISKILENISSFIETIYLGYIMKRSR